MGKCVIWLPDDGAMDNDPKSLSPHGQAIPAPSHSEKVRDFIALMSEAGVSQYHVAPPLYRLLWRLGVKVRPPHFQSFLVLTSITGGLFGLGMLCVSLLWADVPNVVAFLLSSMAGVTFGVTMAAYFKQQAKDIQLPSWDKYQPGFQIERALLSRPVLPLPSWIGYVMWGAVVGLILVALIALLLAYLHQESPFWPKAPATYLGLAYRYGIFLGLGLGSFVGFLLWWLQRAWKNRGSP
jgi:hypothetical protein